MSHGIQIRLHFHPPQNEREGEPTAHANNRAPDVLPTASGNENGAIFFDLDWLNQQADSRKQQVNQTLYSNNQTANGNQNNSSLPEVVIETARSIVEPEKLPEKTIEHARDRVEQNYRQTEATARDAHQTVEQRKAEVEPRKQNQTQTDSPPRENHTQTRNADSPARTQTQSPPRNEQTATTAQNQTRSASQSPNARENVNQTAAQTAAPTANNNNRTEQPPVNPRTAQTAAPEVAEKNLLTANGNLLSKTVPADPKQALPKGESVPRDANNFLPKPANTNQPFAETSTRIFNQSNPETAANNAAAKHENGVPIGGALINGATTEIEDYSQLENIQVGGFGSENEFYDATGNIFAAGAFGALMSATVGSVVPSVSGAVGGVLGFVSGIVAGTEIEPALRWLSSDKADAANNLLTAKTDEPSSENFGLQLGYA